MTDASRTVLEHLRDANAFQWYVILLLLIVLYVYAVEVERRNWNVSFAGLAFWGMLLAVCGVVAAKLLPADRHLRVLGVPNRWALAGAGAAAAVAVEIVLNTMGALTWEWSWWRAGMPLLVWLIGYLPFFLVAYWVHDMPKVRSKAAAVGALLGMDALALIVFVSVGWI
ncbi:hypothetical protein ACFZCG_25370 [Streptomyces tanashiensis]|uniref:hypothetical protein n=1 Tax=Streptomyces tanashiensis TaxID=67367 RepID=UPI0036E415F6